MGYVKPDIVFFGEPLPKEFSIHVNKDFDKCDLLIIMGTSLKVSPFNSLILYPEKDCPRVLINRDAAGENILKFTDEKNNYRDVFHQSDCDRAVKELAELLGWKDEFEILLNEKKKN